MAWGNVEGHRYYRRWKRAGPGHVGRGLRRPERPATLGAMPNVTQLLDAAAAGDPAAAADLFNQIAVKVLRRDDLKRF